MSVFTVATQVLPGNESVSFFVYYLKQSFVCIKLLISAVGAVTIFVGAVLAGYRYLLYRLEKSQKFGIDAIRLDLARTIILGLEFFVASDVIETTIAPDFSSLGILGLLVLIRTFLNFTLQREVTSLSEKSAELTN